MFISLTILFYILYFVINIVISTFYAKQNFYESTNNKNVFLIYILKISNMFLPVLKLIKVKLFINYTDKLDGMLKIFNFNDIKINSYNFIFIQLLSMLTGCFISLMLFGFDVLFMMCFGLLFLILPYLKIYEQYNKRINEIIKQIPDVSSLLAIMVYSGIDFNGAINKIVMLLDGHFIDELKYVIKKISLGIDTKQAFKELKCKCNS